VVLATTGLDKAKAVSVTRDRISAMGPVVATGGLAKVKPVSEIRDPISATSLAAAIGDRAAATLSTGAMAARHATFPSEDKPVSVTAARANLLDRPEAAEVGIKWVAGVEVALTSAEGAEAGHEWAAVAVTAAVAAADVVVVAGGAKSRRQTN
jgi:hypothetical protein